MCISFRAPTSEIMEIIFSAPVIDQPEWPKEVWQDYLAPVVLGDGDSRTTRVGSYGMVPQKRRPPQVKRMSTMNARSETIGEKRSYSKQWREGKLCLVPCMHFYEPMWLENDTVHVRHKIGLADGRPFGVAGLWKEWSNPDGTVDTSFTQLTMNADDHPFMNQFHRSTEEKRSLIIVPEAEWDAWLGCRNPEEARSFFQLYPPAFMVSEPAPKAAKKQTDLLVDEG